MLPGSVVMTSNTRLIRIFFIACMDFMMGMGQASPLASTLL
jgi:hypothetical protein